MSKCLRGIKTRLHFHHEEFLMLAGLSTCTATVKNLFTRAPLDMGELEDAILHKDY